MSRKTNLGRIVIAGFLVAILLSGIFITTTPISVYAEGGGTEPIPIDSTVPADFCPAEPGIGSMDITTLSIILFIMENVL